MNHLKDVLPRGVELAHDLAPAKWVIEGLRTWGTARVPVARIVPERFESYARIQHVDGSMEGSLPEEQMRALTAVLLDVTTTPEDCWFCMWDGNGQWFKGSHKVITLPASAEMAARLDRVSEERDRIMRQAPVVKAQSRDYFLFRGPVQGAESLTEWEGPNIWWPDDRAWCVGTDIDLRDTYVASNAETIARVVGTAELNATEVGPDDDVNELHPW